MEPSEKLKEYGDQMESEDFARFWTDDSSATEIIPVLELFYSMYYEQANVMKNNLHVLDELKNEISMFLFSNPLMDYLDIKTFIPSLSLTHDISLAKSIGEPTMPSVVSDVCSPFGDKLNIFERAFNAFSAPYLNFILGYPEYRSFKSPYNIIDIQSIEPEASFVFLNSNPFVDFPRPTLTKTIEIGGISVNLNELRSQKLDEKWSSLLNKREKTMLISFGSVLFSKDMPLENKKALVSAIKKLQNVTFIWKYEEDETDDFAKDADNIHFVKWVPQTALLADSRLSAFFTHAGLGSINEVSYLGKPTILTFFTPTIIRKFSNIKYVKSTKHVIHLEPSDKLVEYGNALEDKDISRFWTDDSSLSEIFPMLELFNRMFLEQVVVLGENINVLDEMKSRNFDVMIFESFVESAYPLLDYLQIKTFIPSTSIAYDPSLLVSIGEPRMPSAVPLPMSKFNDKMTLIQRMSNAIAPRIIDFLLTNPEIKSFRPPYSVIDIPSQESLSSFIFTNSNPYIDYPRPTIEKNVQIGGISVDVEQLKSQKANEEWDRILNLRSKTVLISFGSIMLSKDMPIENKKSLAKTMEKFPEVTFIWKYESNDTDSFAEGIENIHFSKWVPQTALLGNYIILFSDSNSFVSADSRLSAFFTHAGLGSVNEVSYLGKPSIMCPLFADQMRNAKMLSRHNGSIEISKYDLDDSKIIENSLRTILYDESYRMAAQNLALQLENQPVKPRELLIRHAEFAAQFGRISSLDPHSRHMSFIQYFLIDVALILLFSLFLIFFVVFQMTKRIINCLPFTLSSLKQKTD
uniref:glucuronosyltransferase n=3 Tax=Caenorhabditis tropicalis TaxID=1561998 RepID=A0A1I7U6S1_9PELO